MTEYFDGVAYGHRGRRAGNALRGLHPVARAAMWLIAAVTLAAPSHAHASEHTFRALLDGRPIGHYRITTTDDGAERVIEGHADFAVRFLGITAYSYTHHAVERWRAGCLAGLESSTNDDGKAMRVRATQDGNGLDVVTGNGRRAVQGCVMTFAYWNPDLRTQSRLLNPQTGELESVVITRPADGSIDVRGVATPATRIRITASSGRIDVWYSAAGEWLGLDSLVDGKHTLSYRL